MNITIFVIVVGLFVLYINQINVVYTLKDKIYLYLFNGLSILFMLIFLYYSIFYGFKRGLFTTFLIWSLFVAATPVPEAGLLVSIPLKNILNIDLGTTQIFVSFFALMFLLVVYFKFRQYLEKTPYGMILIRIMDFGSFSIFVTSILASISLSYLINEGIDFVVFKKKMNMYINAWLGLWFIILLWIYVYLLNRFYSR